jgi:uncharacterized protein YkwD
LGDPSAVDSRGGITLGVVAVSLLASYFIPKVEAGLVRDAEGCPGSGAVPIPDNLQETRASILCLLNVERGRAGLPPLRASHQLELASQLHSEDMGTRDFYAHDTPNGVDPMARAEASGYPVIGATVGENIHWGVEANATPVRIVQDWMESPGHRENILRLSFTEVGVGVAHDPPERDVSGRVGVYTTDFGGRIYP